MSINFEIAAIFYEIAEILEMQNVAWKPRAYREAAGAIESLKEDIKSIYRKGRTKELEKIPGVGKELARKIEEYIKTGKIKEHQRLLSTVPMQVRELMKIPGLGARRIKILNKILKIKTLKQLESAVKAHKIAKIPGFGKKSEKNILESIRLAGESKGRIPLELAQKAANGIISQLKKLKELKRIDTAGSTRRKRPFVRDLDIIASSNEPEKVISAFTSLPEIHKVLGKGKTKAIVILKSGVQADLRVLKPESYGAGLYYFTGSKNYDIMVRKIAIKKGFKLNEYGLFDRKTGKMIAGRTEKEITDKLGIKLPKPEDREM